MDGMSFSGDVVNGETMDGAEKKKGVSGGGWVLVIYRGFYLWKMEIYLRFCQWGEV